MKKIIHPLAGATAFLTIATFWTSTIVSELSGSKELIVSVKSTIPWGFFLLIPALMATGASGFALSKGNRGGAVGVKLKRMPFIAANGVLVLIPAALFLASKAQAGAYDMNFYIVQALELLAGATNLTLLGLNMRDGLRMTGRITSKGATSFQVKLLGRDVVADGTMAFRFSKPSGFAFRAGQYVSLELINPPETDAEGATRRFTLACAPHEAELMIATRMRDTAFKRVLKCLPIGASVAVTGPMGDLALRDNSTRPVVCLAGGIGITPFLAMARYAVNAGLSQNITLFYSNRQAKDAAFLAELLQLQQINPRFRVVATLSEQDSSWNGEIGLIDEALLRRHLTDISTPTYYVAGPGAFVTGMQELLQKMDVSQRNIQFDQFYGY